VLFPLQDGSRDISTYCDASENGNTVISPAGITDSLLSFSYTLRQGAEYPYAGLFLGLMKGDTFLDVSRYDFLCLDITSGGSGKIAVYLKTFIDGYTILSEQFTHEFLVKEITLDSATRKYRIPLSTFTHPAWWLEESTITETQLKKTHLNKMISMQIQNGILTPFDTPVSLNIREISFGKDRKTAFVLPVAALILYYLLYFVVYMMFIGKAGKQRVVIGYKELTVENDTDQDMKRLAACVARNYSDPGFTVEKLAREAGVSSSRIPGMLKDKFNLNFKQYLNTIRITEAKRLLRETDNQIVTLAYTVGYNNIPHFNRTFKQFEGISPKEYRKKNKTGNV
jgi:AraC-like DNA-binding protein